jgi:hypothetical protein
MCEGLTRWLHTHPYTYVLLHPIESNLVYFVLTGVLTVILFMSLFVFSVIVGILVIYVRDYFMDWVIMRQHWMGVDWNF